MGTLHSPHPVMWEPDKVLSFIASLGENSSLSLAKLAGKAVTLVALATPKLDG